MGTADYGTIIVVKLAINQSMSVFSKLQVVLIACRTMLIPDQDLNSQPVI